MKNYIVTPLCVTEKAAFAEASREELRVLISLIEREGKITSLEELSEIAGVSVARARASLVLWEEEGVIRDCGEPTVTSEFEEVIELGKITERSASTVAKEIRDNNLSDLISECAAMMQKSALSTEEAKIISALYTQLSLGEEFIITLAAYLSDRGRLTAQRLGAEAERLIKRGIDCVEDLEKYITDKANETGAEGELRRIIGIRSRNLSKKEKEYAKKWFYDFGYSDEIVAEAYNLMLAGDATRVSMPYMDKILSHWNELGCKTLEECKVISESEKATLAAESAIQKPPSIPRKKPTPRYGDFDANDAFEKALLRSYGDDSDKK